MALTVKNRGDAGVGDYNRHVDPQVDSLAGYDVLEPGLAPDALDWGPTLQPSGKMGIGGGRHH